MLQHWEPVLVYFLFFCSQFHPRKREFDACFNTPHKKTKVAWEWTEECSRTFKKLKGILSAQPLLHYVNSKEHYFVMIWPMLHWMQCLVFCCKFVVTSHFVPIAFISRSSTATEWHRPILEIEALAVFCVTTFCHHISGKEFTFYCDKIILLWTSYWRIPPNWAQKWLGGHCISMTTHLLWNTVKG